MIIVFSASFFCHAKGAWWKKYFFLFFLNYPSQQKIGEIEMGVKHKSRGILWEAERNCRGEWQPDKERVAHAPKHFTYTLTFQFYLLSMMLSGATSLRAKERQPERIKSRQRQKVRERELFYLVTHSENTEQTTILLPWRTMGDCLHSHSNT